MNSRWVLPAAVVVVIAAAAAALAFGGGSPTPGASGTPTATTAASTAPPPSAAASATPTDASTFSPVPSTPASAGTLPTIEGTSLVPLQNPDGDPAVGRAAPLVSGAAFDGSAVTIGAPGRPQIIVFLAHWCPHCQREVPLLQAWIDAKGMPAEVDLRSVATAIDPTRPNYPPDAWLAAEHWSVPLVVDPTNAVADAYGLTAFPFWVFLDSEGKVALRATGELTIDQIEQVIGLLATN